MAKSEFPETKFGTFTQRFGWIFSPLLFLSLVALTLFVAQGLQVDSKGNIERKGSIHIKELKNADFYIDDVKVGRTGDVFDTTQTQVEDEPLNVKVTKEGRKDWLKTVKPREGFVSVYYPIMYPKEMKFEDEEIIAHKVYRSTNPNQFFYDKVEDGKLNLYRYTIERQIFLLQNRNDKIADITNTVSKTPLLTSKLIEENPDSLIKSYSVIPSSLGKFALLAIPDERLYILNESGKISQVPNLVPKKSDNYLWSPEDNFLAYQSGEEILSIDPNTAASTVIFRPTASDEVATLQFVVNNGLVYKVKNNSGTDLVENSFRGNDARSIDLPNIESIRKDNLSRAYSLIDKQGLILVQTESNIYSYNLTTSEIKKFNKFDSEQIVIVDTKNQVVLTENAKTPNQFRYYNLDTNESKTFTIDKVDAATKPESVSIFNYAQNAVFVYDEKIIFSDIDGANAVEYSSDKNPGLALAVKEDVNVALVIAERASSLATDTRLKLKFERFEN